MTLTRFFTTSLIFLCSAFSSKAELYIISPGMDFEPDDPEPKPCFFIFTLESTPTGWNFIIDHMLAGTNKFENVDVTEVAGDEHFILIQTHENLNYIFTSKGNLKCFSNGEYTGSFVSADTMKDMATYNELSKEIKRKKSQPAQPAPVPAPAPAPAETQNDGGSCFTADQLAGSVFEWDPFGHWWEDIEQEFTKAGLVSTIAQPGDVFVYFNDPDHPESNPYDIRICGSEYPSRGAYIYLRGSKPCDYYMWTFPFYDYSNPDMSGTQQKARQLFDTMCSQLNRAGYTLEKTQDDPKSGAWYTGAKGNRAITIACFPAGNRYYVQLHVSRQ